MAVLLSAPVASAEPALGMVDADETEVTGMALEALAVTEQV